MRSFCFIFVLFIQFMQVSIDSDRKKSDTDLAQFAGILHNVVSSP